MEFATATLLVLCVVIGLRLAVEKERTRRLKTAVELAKKTAEEAVAVNERAISQIDLNEKLTDMLNAPAPNFENLLEFAAPLPKDAKRVYGGMFEKNSMYQLILSACDTFEEFIEQTKHLSAEGWASIQVNHVDVFQPKVIARKPTLEEKKAMNAEQGLYFLQLALERFAEPRQKKAMQTVISNYKKTYELS